MHDVAIASVMSRCPVFVSEDTPIDRARSLMYCARVHHLPVMRGECVVGLLTDRDLNLVAYLANDLVDEESLTAGDVCVADPYVVDAHEPLGRVARTMAARRIGSAPVVDRGRLVGIFTAHDACRELAARVEEEAPVAEAPGTI